MAVTPVARFDRSDPRHLEAELVSHLRVIDQSLPTIARAPADARSLERARSALDEIRATGALLRANGLVSVAGVLADSIELVAGQPAVAGDEALCHLREISAALRSIVVALTEGGDPRPLLAMTWASFQALQELNLAAVRNASLGRLACGSSGIRLVETVPSPVAQHEGKPLDTFLGEYPARLERLRSCADAIEKGGLGGHDRAEALRTLHALKGAAGVAGLDDVRESCHRSEERVQRIAAERPGGQQTLSDEIRLAADSVEELVQHYISELEGRDGFTGLNVDHDGSSTGGSVREPEDRGDWPQAEAELRDATRRLRAVLGLLEATAERVGSHAGGNLDYRGSAHLLFEIEQARADLARVQQALATRITTPPDLSRPSTTVGELAGRLRMAFAALLRDSGKLADLEVQGTHVTLPRETSDLIYDPLVQLIGNALDHGIEPAAERVAAGKPERGMILLRACSRGASVVLEVFDDGAGMCTDVLRGHAVRCGVSDADATLDDADALNVIFTAGFTTRATSDTRSGRGIGLDVVRSAVERLGGDVVVASTPGTGSCFRISLPIGLPAGLSFGELPEGPQARDTPEDHATRTALVVDDSLGVRRVLGRILQRHGWRTVQARDGAEALRIIAAEPPDLVLTDVEMPGVDGYELIRSIRAQAPWSNLPIVVMTSRTSEARQDELDTPGADCVLGKPFDEQSVVQAIDRATRLRSNDAAAA